MSNSIGRRLGVGDTRSTSPSASQSGPGAGIQADTDALRRCAATARELHARLTTESDDAEAPTEGAAGALRLDDFRLGKALHHVNDVWAAQSRDVANACQLIGEALTAIANGHDEVDETNARMMADLANKFS